MKRIFVLVMILAFLCPSIGFPAQVQEPKQNAEKTNSKDGVSLAEMRFSEEQNKNIEEISATYRNKILQLRSELIVKQIELKSLLRDPEADEKKIRAMARDIRILNVQRQKMMIDYQLEIRNVLTPEQIRSWSTLENPPIKRGWK
ncbi:MAG: periplasmic heavy metal sensor [Syntrophobacterales bacterium]|nr:periplasmic heavy metal sensor [Syntrophobacterales bacterium]